MFLRHSLAAAALILAFSPACRADHSDLHAKILSRIHTHTCVKHAGDRAGLFQELRAREQRRLFDDEARPYVKDDAHDAAWLVRNKVGEWVVTLSSDGVCTVSARRADTETAEDRQASAKSKQTAGKQVVAMLEPARR